MGCGCKNNKKSSTRPNRNQLNPDLIKKVVDKNTISKESGNTNTSK